MVGLSDDGAAVERAGFTPERQSAAFKHLAEAHGMPIDTSVRARTAATMPACRAVVATRLHAPQSERAVLRAVRVLHFSGELLDDPQTLDRAARDAGLDPAELERWSAASDTEEALAEDLRLARDPSPGALALAHKLAGDGNGGGTGTRARPTSCAVTPMARRCRRPGFSPRRPTRSRSPTSRRR